MAKATGTIDYGALLKRLPAGTRQGLYTELIEGGGEQPGIAKQYVNALVEWRSLNDLVTSRKAFIEAMPADLTEKVRGEALEEYARLVWQCELRRHGLDSIATELGRLQDALGELEQAGTG